MKKAGDFPALFSTPLFYHLPDVYTVRVAKAGGMLAAFFAGPNTAI
jgi:hypothetical protein